MLNPRNVIFVKVNIIFQFVIQKSKIPKSNDSRNPPKNVPPKCIPQETPEKQTEEASVNQVISSVESLIQNENIGNDTTTTLLQKILTHRKMSSFKHHKPLFHLSIQGQKGKGEFYLIIVLKKVSSRTLFEEPMLSLLA